MYLAQVRREISIFGTSATANLAINVIKHLKFFTFTKGVGNYANLPVNVINHLTFFTFTKAVGNYAKLPVYVNNEALFLTFTNTAGNYAKLPVILQNYQFITFTITYIYINCNLCVCLCVFSYLNTSLTAVRINLIFGMHTLIWSDCAIGLMILTFGAIKGHFRSNKFLWLVPGLPIL